MYDLSKLTLGEIAKIEELTGLSIGALADDTAPKAKMLIAIAFVLKRRENPKFTYIDAEQLTMSDLAELGLGGEVEPDPEA